MSIELLTMLMFGSLVLLLALGMPLVFVLGGLTMIFGFMLMGDTIFIWTVFRTWSLMSNFGFIAIPLFVFMANMLRYSGIAEDLYNAIYVWLGPLRGGLAVASVIACTIIAAMVGIVGAGVVIMGLIALPYMLRQKYDKHLAAGVVMAGGSLGVLIPPSVLFILYGVNAEVSIGKLFMGGVVPGLLLAGLYSIYIVIRAWLQREWAPAVPKEMRVVSLTEKINRLRGVILPTFLILAVMGSIYGGLATVSEAAGVGAIGAMIAAAVRRKFNWRNLRLALFDSMKAVGMLLWIAFSAYAFVGVYLHAGGSEYIKEVLLGTGLGRWGILAITQLLLIILGMFMDWVGILFLAVPVVLPIVVSLGFDPIWFGVLFCVNMQIAYLSPPFGYAMFYLKVVAPPEISMTDLYRAVFPFMGMQLLGLGLIMAFPQIVLWLPSLME